jgi:hypothetical protein
VSRRAWSVVVGLVIVACAGAVAFVLGSGDGTTPAAGSQARGTATVERRDLVETDDEDGTLGFADSRTVVNHLTGTITWLPHGGRTIAVDHALFRVDDEPVVLLDGTSPAYRTLSPATTKGPDVRELERNLRALGYDPSHAMSVDGTWDAGTTAAVERWQKAHGLDETGSIELGRVVFLPGQRRRVGTVDATLGGSAASSGDRAGASWDGDGGTIVDVVDTTTSTTPTTTTPTTTTTPAKTTTTPTTTTPVPTTTTPAAPGSGTARTPAASGAGGGGAGVGAGDLSGGGGGGDGGSGDGAGDTANTVMTTTSLRRVVTVALATTKQELARRGSRVTVTLPSGDTVPGTVSAVSRVAKAADAGDKGDGGSSDPTVTVTIHLTRATGSRLDQAPVTVSFARSRRRDVLSVPVTALLARAGGRFAVERIADGRRRLVPVVPGLYAGGYVEIAGPGIRPGMTVANAQDTA